MACGEKIPKGPLQSLSFREEAKRPYLQQARRKKIWWVGESYLVKICGGEQMPPPPAPLLEPTCPLGSTGPVQFARLAPAMTPSTIVHGLCSKPTVNIPTCFIRNTLAEAVCSQNLSNSSDQNYDRRSQIALEFFWKSPRIPKNFASVCSFEKKIPLAKFMNNTILYDSFRLEKPDGFAIPLEFFKFCCRLLI